MEDVGKTNTITMTREDLELLINSSIQKALQQQQQQVNVGGTLPVTMNPVISTTDRRRNKGMEEEEIAYITPAPVSPTRHLQTFFRALMDQGGRKPVLQESSDEAPMKENRKGKAITSDSSPERIVIPFSWRVLDDPLPKHYQTLNIGEYSRTTDLEDHLSKFESAVLLQQFTDGVKCRMFLTTLREAAQRWFKKLPKNYIKHFKDFRKAFLHHFSSNRRYHKTPWSLFSIKQEPKERIRAYIKRFNQVAVDVPNATTEILLSAFSQGLNDNNFFKDLVRNLPINFDLLIDRATEFINVEEAQAARKKETIAPAPLTINDRTSVPVHPPRGPRAVLPPHRQPEQRSHAVQHVQIPQEIPRRWCTYHMSGTHSTENCYALKNQRTNEGRYGR
ncbi:uncharacterized protein LOC121972564 [Zingiber officinale]|uniref:uncharacterized protein LOC121972564 n=1 Tax=Zingiber officinale TaxID=94328 RepID=UPI001C4D5E89|nr:uncharacterized protein LOC121972564 [Zingiber officinale]